MKSNILASILSLSLSLSLSYLDIMMVLYIKGTKYASLISASFYQFFVITKVWLLCKYCEADYATVLGTNIMRNVCLNKCTLWMLIKIESWYDLFHSENITEYIFMGPTFFTFILLQNIFELFGTFGVFIEIFKVYQTFIALRPFNSYHIFWIH